MTEIMKVPEGVEFNCGNCVFMQIVEAPPEKRKDYPVDRGYCIFEPPKVFPMPQAQGKLADIQGRQSMGFAPFMMRPVVEANEPACGRYVMNAEILELIKASQCNCDPPGEECDGCK